MKRRILKTVFVFAITIMVFGCGKKPIEETVFTGIKLDEVTGSSEEETTTEPEKYVAQYAYTEGYEDVDRILNEEHQDLVAYIEKMFVRFQGSVLVAVNGEIIVANGYGYADELNEIPNTMNTTYELGLASLQFTTDAIFDMIEDEVLDLDTDIKKFFPDKNIFAVKPNLEKASEYKKSLVLATPTTIKYLKQSIFINHCIVLRPMQNLAIKIENNLQNLSNIVPYLKRALKEYKDINCIVLGCTHYYYVKDLIKNLFPKAKIIDGVDYLCENILNCFKNIKIKSKKIRVKIIFSKKTKATYQYKKLILSMLKEVKNNGNIEFNNVADKLNKLKR